MAENMKKREARIQKAGGVIGGVIGIASIVFAMAVVVFSGVNQIKRYQRDSFWGSSGLYEYVQIFVISNGTHTKYYSNTTRNSHVKEAAQNKSKGKKTSNSFEFTSFWSDGNNKVIADLVDFTKTFFAKHTLLNLLTRYCVFTAEELLLVMRPYQIAATERILNRIQIASQYKQGGTLEAGGYIWHTTGSGKTLTSFKTAQLACRLPYIDKVLFVVDRKDLDYQTMKEYDRFEKGAANGNTNTAVLQRQLEDPQARILVTTIQKLAVFIRKNPRHPVFKQHVVIIFDECHRSQFGDMHTAIAKHFKNYHLFGFTGTPIFAANASAGKHPDLRTTSQAFGDRLHTYTIVDAINDGNVLPFRIDYVSTMGEREGIEDSVVRAIDRERAMGAPERIKNVVAYTLEHFDQQTKRNSYYSLKGQRVAGFNSIFAVSSIPMAMKYYQEFRRQLTEAGRDLTIATIFSFAPNEEDPEDGLPEEGFETEGLDKPSRDFLDSAIQDYNAVFHTNFDTSSDGFQNYYKDLSARMKAREVDLLIVVNMFLTGFDATTLNTLWVDKNLKMHGLIQAFSRTNRILNSVKTFGNIVCFRNLQKATDAALALFGDKEATGMVTLLDFNSYYYGYEDLEKEEEVPGYIDLVAELLETYPLDQPIEGEKKQKAFINLYGSILRLKNVLTAFDEFQGKEGMSERAFQDYQSKYIDLYQKYRPRENGDREDINDDIVFEMELVRQVEVNIDYILILVSQYHDSNCKDKEILTKIDKAIDSSIQLRSKKDLIHDFIRTMDASTVVDRDWTLFVQKQKDAELDTIIAEEKLKPEETRRFVDNSFRDGSLKTTGTDFDRIMPPVSRFGGGNRVEKKQGVIQRMMQFFEKYLGVA